MLVVVGLGPESCDSWWWNAKNRSRKKSDQEPHGAAQRSVPADPIRTASGSMWKKAAPSMLPAEKLR